MFKKLCTNLFLFSLVSFHLQAQVVITEIMYNPPESGSDFLEFIELNNTGIAAVDLTGYTFSAGVVYTFPSFTLNPGQFVMIAIDSIQFETNFGRPAFEWTSGSLNNGGELIQLSDAMGNVVDEVDYDDSGDWPTSPDGAGPSLVLCDFSADNNIGSNWQASPTSVGVIINEFELFANPGLASDCILGPIVGFLESDSEAIESDGMVSIPVVLENGDASTASVLVTVGIGSSATPGVDATLENTNIIFDPGVLRDTQFVVISLIDDIEEENLEVLQLELSMPSLGVSVNPIAAVFDLNISDNDTDLPDLVITEIMYNNPGNDDYEYVEITNADATAVDMRNYFFSEGVEFTFPTFSLGAGETVVLVSDSALFVAEFPIPVFEFSGALNNSGEDVELRDGAGNLIDRVDYRPGNPWDELADGSGPSLELCDINSDNSDPANWQASNTSTGVFLGGIEVLGSPGLVNDCAPPPPPQFPPYPIGLVTTNDADGDVDSLGVTCELQGIVYGVNLRPEGLQFTLIDANNDGVHLFSASDQFDYNVAEGDEIVVRGTITQFNGLTQISPDTVFEVSTGNTLFNPTVITTLGEDTESQLVTIENLQIIDPTQWTNSGSGFNVAVTNGVDTFSMRIDANVDLFGTNAPDFVFNLTGIGGQFDSEAPYTEGYQILPRYIPDIAMVTGVVNPELAKYIKVFPNPVSSTLNIRTETAIARIYLSNILGEVVRVIPNPEVVNMINMAPYQAGMYFIRFEQEGKIWTERVVKH